jgi:hypothetical protein
MARTVSKGRLGEAQQFVGLLWSGQTGWVYGALAMGGEFNSNGSYRAARWRQFFFVWPDERKDFVEGGVYESEEHDVYVCPMLRRAPNGRQTGGAGGRHLWADLDSPSAVGLANKERVLEGRGSFTVDSGRNEHIYISLDSWYPAEDVEAANHRLAIFLGADAKWKNNSVLRLPGTLNHKGRADGGNPFPVRLFRP